MQAIFRKVGNSINHTPSGAIAAGEVVVQGDLVGVAERAIAASALGALTVRGEFDIKMAAVTITAGQPAYWDADGDPVGGLLDGTGAATNVSTSNKFMGFFPEARADTAETASVVLMSTDSTALTSQTLAALGDVGATAYTAGMIIVADGNSYEEVAVGGDATLTAAGVLRVTSLATMPTIPVSAKTATGSTQAHALAAPTAILATGFNVVAAANDTTCVVLPTAAAGKVVIVKSTVTGKNLQIFPHTDDAINAIAANLVYAQAADAGITMFIAADATTWYTLPLVSS